VSGAGKLAKPLKQFEVQQCGCALQRPLDYLPNECQIVS
jgi:hypothetical protein